MASKRTGQLPPVTLEELAHMTEERGELPSFPKSLPHEVNSGEHIPEELSDFALKVVTAYARHLGDCLNIYEPLPAAQRFHASMSHLRLVSGSNQSGKAQPDSEPVLTPNGWMPIGLLQVGQEVIGGDGKPCVVTGVFPQGEKQVYEVEFDEKTTVRCCADHLWKVCIGNARFNKHRHNEKWSVKSLSEIIDYCGNVIPPIKRPATPVAVCEFPEKKHVIHPYILGALLGDGGLTHGCVISSADSELIEKVTALLPDGCTLKKIPSGKYDYRITGLKDELVRLRVYGKYSYEKLIPDEYLYDSVENRIELLRGLMDTDGSIAANLLTKSFSGTSEFCTTSPRLVRDFEFLVRSLGGKCKGLWRITSFTYKGIKKNGRPSARIRVRMPNINPFSLSRKANRWKAAKSTCDHRLIYSIKRAGKSHCTCISVSSPDQTYITKDFVVTHNTFCAGIEFARIMRGMDPFNKREPGNLLTLVLGKDENHLGQTIWQKLFFPGAFYMLRDEETGLWRAVRPRRDDPLHLDPRDEERRSEWRPAPPMLPAEGMQLAYAKKNKDIPSQLTLANGSKALFHTSRGSARQGIQLDYAWIDEEVINERWVHELIGPRLVRKNGIAVWSATPEDQTPQFFELIKRAEANDPHVELFMLQVADNPYYSDEAKEVMFQNLKAQGEAVLQVKWYGKPAIRGLAVYPGYDQKVHGVIPFQVPENWMRIAAIDPGTQYAAAVFGAVNPDATELHIYDELLVRNEDAAAFARQFKQKVDGHAFDCYLIDKCGSRQRTMGRSNTTFQHYADEFAKAGVPKSRLTGTQFFFGCEDTSARTISLNKRLGDGTLKFHIGRTVLLDGQLPKRYYAKDRPNKRAKQKDIDLVDCLEYLVAYFDRGGLYYHEPIRQRDTTTDHEQRCYEWFKNKAKRRNQSRSRL